MDVSIIAGWTTNLLKEGLCLERDEHKM